MTHALTANYTVENPLIGSSDEQAVASEIERDLAEVNSNFDSLDYFISIYFFVTSSSAV